MKTVSVAVGTRVALVAVFNLLLCTAAYAQRTNKPEAKPSAKDTAKFETEVRRMINQSDEGLTEYELSDGTKIVYLEGRFRNLALVKRNTDGTISAACVNNQKDAATFLKSDTKKESAKQEAALKPKPAPALEGK